MKKNLLITRLLMMALLIALSNCGKKATESLNQTAFLNPPQQSGVHNWWHWLDGQITRDGITKDLEAMKKQGIVEATILNVGLFPDRDFGTQRVIFGSEKWYGMFQWALQEADRLGIKLGIHNCDGWSSTGGPWVMPEKSMKQYVWTKTIVKGGSELQIQLKKPFSLQNFYKDVAIVAYKTTDELNSFQTASPKFLLNEKVLDGSLCDGDPASAVPITKGNSITISFEQPFSASAISILPRISFMWNNADDFISKYSLFISDDGKNFKKILDYSIKGLNKGELIKFPLTSTKYFKITINDLGSQNDWIPFTIGEMELLKDNEKPMYNPSIPFLEEKAGIIKAGKQEYFYTTAKNAIGNQYPSQDEVINLTQNMNTDGQLKWTAPAGNWVVLRFGFTSTGATNGPATKEGTGLEIDKMDTSALNLHYKAFPKVLIEKAGKFAGNTFKFMFIDSWECAYQNWTDNMPAEFEKLRGYSILNYIPVLCGQIMESPDISEAVLFDFRQTIADLIENNYYRHYSNLLHNDKMEFHAEVIYGNANYPPLDILKSTECVDLPMYEFWTSTDNQNMIQYHPQNGYELNMPACAAIGYNKPVMASEAYTGFAHYSESPQNLKSFGDRAFCAGINCMVLHSNVHQPTDKLPGMTLGNFASHFNRNNLYYQFISEWFRYQSRIQYVLQSAPTVPDVLYYLGDQLPQYWVYNQTNTMPFGYYATACNFDILQNKTEVVDGKIRFNKLFDYSLLTLPPFTVINYETLKRIDQLVSAGAVLYGPKPVKTLSLSDVTTNKSAFEQLANKIWGNIDGKTITENSYEKGKVFWGMSMAEVLKKIDLGPDFSTSLPDSLNFMFIHKKMNNDDVYFVANQQNTTLIREFIFRTGEKTPEIWNPLSGEVIEQGIYAYKDGYIKIPVTFKPYESCIFVFRNGKPRLHIESVSCNGKQIFPAENGDALVSVPNALLKDNSISIISDETADYSFGLSNKKVVNQKIEKRAVLTINNFKGKMNFNPAWKTEIDPVEITELKPLSENENPAIKYFAGTVHYSIPFEISNDNVLKADSILLDLGNFEADAQVILNGKLVGYAWLPGALISVKNILKKSNSLEVTIATTFRNRFIGDFVEFGAPKNIWSSATVSEFLNKNSVLKPSGLLGPIQIIAIKMSSIN